VEYHIDHHAIKLFLIGIGSPWNISVPLWKRGNFMMFSCVPMIPPW